MAFVLSVSRHKGTGCTIQIMHSNYAIIAADNLSASPASELLAIAPLLLVILPCPDAQLVMLITVVRMHDWYYS